MYAVQVSSNLRPVSTGSNLDVGISGAQFRNLFQSGYHYMAEMTAPTGTANVATIFAEDNGAGKTRLMCIFGSGAAQQLAIEP